MSRRHAATARRGFMIGAALAMAFALIAALSIGRYRRPPAAAPETLEKIAEKNREAATAAAATMRAESAETTRAAEALAEANQANEAGARRP